VSFIFFKLSLKEQRLAHEKQLSEARRKETEEMHLYMTVRVLTDEDISKHDGFDLFNFEDRPPPANAPVTPASGGPVTFKVKKQDTFATFKVVIMPSAVFMIGYCCGKVQIESCEF
jgi:hypothetical protein